MEVSMMVAVKEPYAKPDAEYGSYVWFARRYWGTYSQGKSVSKALANVREAIS